MPTGTRPLCNFEIVIYGLVYHVQQIICNVPHATFVMLVKSCLRKLVLQGAYPLAPSSYALCVHSCRVISGTVVHSNYYASKVIVRNSYFADTQNYARDAVLQC